MAIMMRLLGRAAILCTGVSLVTPYAMAQSGYQTINGTQVYTQVDQARGVATFSNSCGSQTLTQRELQNGAIPSRIIPCPRPQAKQPPTFDIQKERAKIDWALSVNIRDLANKSMQEARRHEQGKRYSDAHSAYLVAHSQYLEVGDAKQADIALKNSTRVVCGREIQGVEEGIERGTYGFDKIEKNDFPKHLSLWRIIRDIDCQNYPSFLQHIDRKIAALEKKIAPSPAPTSQPHRDSSGSSRWLPPGSPNRPMATNPPPAAPLKEIHMGNKGNETGAKEPNGGAKGRPAYGLSDAVRRKLDALRNDPVRRREYIAGLSATDRTKAEAYLKDAGTGGGTGGVQFGSATPAHCATALNQLRPRSPNPEWLKDMMERSYCHVDGTPMTAAEEARYRSVRDARRLRR